MDTSIIIQSLSEATLSILSMVIAALITWASRSLKRYIESKEHFASFNCALTKIEVLSRAAVEEVEQTLVRQFKAEGKWDVETATRARDTALEIVKRHLGDKGMTEIKGCLGMAMKDIERLVLTKIESFVSRSGSGLGPVVPP